MPSQKLENLKKEIAEVRLLLDGLTAYQEIPGPIIELAISKTDQLKRLLEELKTEGLAPPLVQTEPAPERGLPAEPGVEPLVEVDVPVEEVVPVFEETTQEETSETLINDAIPEVQKEEMPEEEQADEQPLPVNSTVIQDAPEPVNERETNAAVKNAETPTTEKEEVNPKPVEAAPAKSVLADTLASHKKVMNDVIGNSGSPTLGKRIESSAINDLKRAIPINDRFRFQRELFNNNVSLFNETLARLNSMPDFEEARAFLLREFEWDDEQDSTRDFLVLLGRRFVK